MLGHGLGFGILRVNAFSGGPPPYFLSMDFSDARNSQYLSLISAFVG